MTLVWLILIPLIAGVLAWIVARWSEPAARWISLLATILGLALSLGLWSRYAGEVHLSSSGQWLMEADWTWIPQLGIHFHLAMDGLSLLLLVLTFLLGIVSVLTSWREIKEGVGFFHLNLMWILAGIAGVFLAVDLFLFYFAWELMLVPMYFLIAIWGHERRVYAAIKFFIFTQACGLLMLLSILALYFVHHAATGIYTFEYSDLLGTTLSPHIPLHAVVLSRIFGETAHVSAASVAARRAHRSPDGGQRDIGRLASQDRSVRSASVRGAAVSRCFARVRAHCHDIGRYRHHLRRRHGICPD